MNVTRKNLSGIREAEKFRAARECHWGFEFPINTKKISPTDQISTKNLFYSFVDSFYIVAGWFNNHFLHFDSSRLYSSSSQRSTQKKFIKP